MFDLILRGGRILDGAANSDFPGDVAIEQGRIVALGALATAEAREIVNVSGLTVAPGFIDVHSHSDALPFASDLVLGKILQGVTTEIAGNCGSTPYPINPATKHLLQEHLTGVFSELPWDWTGLDGYFERLEQVGPLSNHAALLGHGALRAAVLGFDDRRPSTDELRQMQRLLAKALEDGAAGFSSGLIYAPGVFSDTDELIALATVLRGSGRPYVSHIRGETHNLFNALDEALRIGEQAGVPVQVSHLKAAGRPNYGRGPEMLAAIDAARAKGLEVTADTYPYDAGSGRLMSVLPPWCLAGGSKAALERMTDPALRKRLAREFETGLEGWVNLVAAAGWDNIWIAGVAKTPAYQGKSISEIAEMNGVQPSEALCDVLIGDHGTTMMTLRMMREDDVRAFLVHPLVMIGSDAVITHGRPHPRTWGTYPRVLGLYARDLGLFSQAEAIRKMTSYPAQKFGLFDRGLVRPGMWADLVVFNAATVTDRATYEDPEQSPIGMPHVLVNGQFAVRDGQYSGARAGKALRL